MGSKNSAPNVVIRSMVEKEGILDKQQWTLDRIHILNAISDFKEVLKKLNDRLLEFEVKVGTMEQGMHLMWSALELAGFVRDGEPSATAPTKKSKFDVENLVGQLKAERKDSKTSKGPYFLAKLRDNQQNQAFSILQEKLRQKDGFWSKKTDAGLYKFWFFNNDITRLCYRKE